MSFRRGEIVLVIYPHSDLRTYKKRPALVVQADDIGTGLPQAIVAMITSNLSRAGHPSRVAVQRGSPIAKASGLLTDSVVMTDNLATVLTSEIDRAVGCLDDMAGLDQALAHTLGL